MFGIQLKLVNREKAQEMDQHKEEFVRLKLLRETIDRAVDKIVTVTKVEKVIWKLMNLYKSVLL